MRKFLNLLRHAEHYRKQSFDAGLKKLGYTPASTAETLGQGDVLLIWNRYGGTHERAISASANGATVLVAENCPLGNKFRPGVWYSIARDNVALSGGVFEDMGAERWDDWGIELSPWRGGNETVILSQRGIGAPDVHSPAMWAESMKARLGGHARVRPHPGSVPTIKPLAEDLVHAAEVITWNSAGGVQALAHGVPVFHVHPHYIMAGASRRFADRASLGPNRSDADRLRAFRRLAWCIWECESEIATGAALEALLP